jgi:transcriptional repressor NrdR
MKCPFCGNEEQKVIDSRETEDSIRRRRECLKCEKRFTTYERIENVEIIVIKKDGRREMFDRNKIKAGMLKACEKRSISIEVVDKAVDDIEKEIRRQEGTEIEATKIGEMIMKKLKGMDKVAYIRFASVYREFEDISSFEQELKKLKK